jgi:short-subunit dehydrogenase
VRVSALCPGFVKTNLAKGQKWTERLGSEPGAAQTPMAQMMDAVLAQGVEEGIEATDVADQVVDAIRTERFWILTHPEMRQAPVERMQRAADQTNPG